MFSCHENMMIMVLASVMEMRSAIAALALTMMVANFNLYHQHCKKLQPWFSQTTNVLGATVELLLPAVVLPVRQKAYAATDRAVSWDENSFISI
jgi:hypothetical protein